MMSGMWLIVDLRMDTFEDTVAVELRLRFDHSNILTLMALKYSYKLRNL